MKKALNSNALKLIAIIAMTVDHVAWLIFPGYPAEPIPIIMHVIGRITCPVMCYFIAEGYHHTRDINKYTARLFIFAFISHFAYVFASGSFVDAISFIPFYYGKLLDQTSVMWSLAWGLVLLRISNSERLGGGLKLLLTLLICLVSFPADWSCIAALTVLAFGTNRGNLKAQALWMLFYVSIYAIVYALALDVLYGIIQLAVALAIPLIALYNGERGRSKKLNKILKWAFYVYYPLHLAIIGLIKLLI